MGSCSAPKKYTNKSIKYGDRIITCNVETEKDIFKTTFNSQTLIKEVKISLKKQILKNQHEKMLVKIYYNGKELKDNSITLGSAVDGDEVILVMASIPLTEEVINDDRKLDEMLIKNLTKFCEIHKDEKALLFCLSCNHSICKTCEKDHKNHNFIQKVEIINYEQTLRENKTNLNNKLKEMGLDGKYSDFHKSFKQELDKQTEELLNLVEEIKKKEHTTLYEFKSKFDNVFPNILDYRDKLSEMINNVSELKKGSILRNDSEFVEFYNKYTRIGTLNEKSKENLDVLKIKTEKFKSFYLEFKAGLEEILDVVNIHYNKIKDFQLNENVLSIQYKCEPLIVEKNPEEQKFFQQTNSSTGNFQVAKMNLINLMTSPQKAKGLIHQFEKYSKNKIDILKKKDNPNIAALNLENLNEQEKNMIAVKSNSQDMNKFVITTEPSTKNIYIFEKNTKLIIKKELDLSNVSFKKFDVYHSTLNYGNKFYIGGGNSKIFLEYDYEKDILKKLKNMITVHSYHTLIGMKDAIYVISGFNSKKVEKYYIESDTWTNQADLNFARCWPSCLFFENKYLYVFGGLKEKEKTGNKQIERLEFIKSSATWEIFEINFDESFPFYSGILKFNPQQIYIFGGKFSTEENTNKCFSFNLNDKSVSLINNLTLPNEDEFDGKELVSLDHTENKFGTFSSLTPQKFYLFDKETNSFEVIQFECS